MRRLLLDANLSPRSSEYLRATVGFDVVDLVSLGLAHFDDTEVIELAKDQNRIVVTEDLDFGRLYYRYERGQIGVIGLRLRSLSAMAVNRVLERFFTDASTDLIDLERSLVVISDSRIRVTSEP